ncbi:MAG: hypothetical protein ACP5N7_00185 [Candidatus Pacearchaeota archaeon]
MTYIKQPLLNRAVALELVKGGRAGRVYRRCGKWFVTTFRGRRKMKEIIYQQNFRNGYDTRETC